MAELSTRVEQGPLRLLAAVLVLTALAPHAAQAAAPVHLVTVQPNAGPSTGGISVTLQGTGFQPGAQVKFGAGAVVGTFTSPTSMTAVVANLSPGYGPIPVEVDNPDGGRSLEQVSFNAYERLPALASIAAAAHAGSHQLPNDAQVDVFVPSFDFVLHHTYHTNVNPAWASWESMDGAITSSVSAVSWGNLDRIDLFGRGTDQALWHKWWNGTAWSGWESLGGVLNAGPVATSWGPGRLDVFVRGSDNELWHRSFAGDSSGAGTWSGWEPLGGAFGASSEPGAVSWGRDRIDVFVRGTDSALWHRWWNATQWGGWESLGGALAGSPDAASAGLGDLEVYALGAGSNLYHRAFSGIWLGWRAEGPFWSGGSWAYDPGVVSQGGPLGVDTVEVGSDGGVYHTVTSAAQPPGASVRGARVPRTTR
jgi:IPT/TIG domain